MSDATPHLERSHDDGTYGNRAYGNRADGHPGEDHLGDGHGHGPVPKIATSLRARLITLGVLALVAAATALGIAGLWPDYAKVGALSEQSPYAVAGTTFEKGEVLGVDSGCSTISGSGEASSRDPSADGGANSANAAAACIAVSIGIRTGPESGRVVDLAVRGPLASSGLQKGDTVELGRYPRPTSVAEVSPSTGAGGSTTASPPSDAPAARYELSQSYTVAGIFRHVPLAVLALVFVIVVVAVGRLRGLLAVVALAISAGVILAFILPALLSGRPGLLVGVVGASAIMFVILYLVHGPNMRTTAALIGTLCGILITAGISLASVALARLSGLGDEASSLLSGMAGTLDFRGLLSCSIIIAGLGVLNDVTITQASAVWELRAAAPAMSSGELYRRAMRIGRDHIASTVYTVFFAYVGAALSVLIVLYLYGQPFLSLLTREDIAAEIVRTLCGSIGLVLAVPITTWVATLFAAPVSSANRTGDIVG